MVADGRTPWCFGMGSGPNSGFMATDWVEELVMRTGGVEIYDRWISHQVRFTDPTIQRAVEMFGTVMFSDGFLVNGSASAVRAGQQEALVPMYADTPGCWMYLGGSWVATNLPARANLGTDADYFRLPPVENGVTATPLLGGFVAAALSDRPEVRELIRFIASKRWGSVGPSVLDDAFIPPHREMAVTGCVSEAASLEANTVRVRRRHDSRVIPPQPAPHRGRVLFVGAPQWFFRAVKPQRARYLPTVRMASTTPQRCRITSQTAARFHKANGSPNSSGGCLR